MAYELCVPDTVSTGPKRADDSALINLRERIASAESLGLTVQTQLHKEELRYLENKPEGLSPLTVDEMSIWHAWLPTIYRDDAHCPEKNVLIRKLSSYAFDRIPSPVYRLWVRLEKQKVFDYYEIWTPEKEEKTDPVLIGVLAGQHHLLARWGESDANLITFENVVASLWKNWPSTSDLSFSMTLLRVGIFLSRLTIIGMSAVITLLVWPSVFESPFGFSKDEASLVLCTFVVLCAIGATWFRMKRKGEQSLVNLIFNEDSKDTEHLQAICRVYGKVPKRK